MSCSAPWIVGIAAGVEIHRLHRAGAQFAEQLDVARPGGAQPAGGGNDHDIGLRAAAQFDETGEDGPVVLFFLCAADRNDPAAFFTLGDFAWTHESGLRI